MTVVNRYLEGQMAPVADEVTAFDLPVSGAIPTELEGRWLRNGPNPIAVADPSRHHWFGGDGMVHAVRLRGGRAEWYRNRYVRADKVATMLGETPPAGPAFGGRTETGPNTNVGGFAGRSWALVEGGGTPVELTYELDTIGRNDFDGTLPAAFSAHPKLDPETGELHAMTYSWPDLVDRLQYVVVDRDGRVTKVVDIPVSDMPMVHDISITPNHAVIYDLSVTVRFDLLEQGFQLPVGWNPDHPSRIGLLPRSGSADDIVWCEVEQCFLFHPLNAYERDDGHVVIDVCRYENLFVDDVLGPFSVDSPPTLDRWTIDPVSRKVHEERIDDRAHEFPRHDPRVGLREHRFGYTATVGYEGPSLHGSIYKTDYRTGALTEHDFGAGRGGAEPVFVPRDGSTGEDDGWVMVLVHDAATDGAELHIIDAIDFASPAVAVIDLPQRVPIGFHGNWVGDDSVPPA
ncbi:MAG: carotenoid oxygenase family protein [Acidimicrobiia bacterium]|nr:carotenoid oxygenase family protein [Acidimicrobiia bacterium]